MTMTADLCGLSLHELAARIRSKDVSPVEATEACLERVERLNPKLNTFITAMAEQALADARAAADEIAAGRYRGAMHGVPVGVKDLCDIQGLPTTAASKIFADNVASEDSTVVRKLREAGAVIVGKTHLHEWALGTTGHSSHYGDARNPWDTERVTGGSSSGSGNGVASGQFFAAIGSDTGGSIRVPSSLCGVTGIKPTYGRVSLRGVVPLSWTLDHLGPMARSARDCALLLEAIAGYDEDDPGSANAPVEAWSQSLDGGLAGLRIGVPRGYIAQQTQPEVAQIFEGALATLEDAGASIRDVELSFGEYWSVTAQVLLAEAGAYHEQKLKDRPQDYDAGVRARLEAGTSTPSATYIKALRRVQEIRRTCDEALLGDLDLLAMPATPRAAVTIESVKSDDPTIPLTHFTGPFNGSGQPALSTPCGLIEGGLPVGLQLVGRRFDEKTVLRAAHAFEEARGPFPMPNIE
jgi:aspartyl-tRNA(Asn)/glutamyl-tRNA(Gln) amidotransferase subunit A